MLDGREGIPLRGWKARRHTDHRVLADGPLEPRLAHGQLTLQRRLGSNNQQGSLILRPPQTCRNFARVSQDHVARVEKTRKRALFHPT